MALPKALDDDLVFLAVIAGLAWLFYPALKNISGTATNLTGTANSLSGVLNTAGNGIGNLTNSIADFLNNGFTGNAGDQVATPEQIQNSYGSGGLQGLGPPGLYDDYTGALTNYPDGMFDYTQQGP